MGMIQTLPSSNMRLLQPFCSRSSISMTGLKKMAAGNLRRPRLRNSAAPYPSLLTSKYRATPF